MTKVKFYSGLREIGGTVVGIETDKAVCIFDFGFANVNRLDDNIRLRPGREAFDYTRLGVLNAIDGIYEKEAATQLGLKAYGETDKEVFIIISHMHIDHMGGLGALAPELPVYMSTGSARLYHELGVMGQLEVREHENVQAVDFDASFTVGDIKVTCVPVDHDVVGACGFLIETAEGRICYTGDFRFHGYHPEITGSFAEKCKGADLMISEGVTISFADVDVLALEGPERETGELTLLEKVKDYSAEKDGLIVINNYNRNVERLHNMIGALAGHRTFALDAVQADLLAAFYPEDDFCIYLPEGGSVDAPLIKDRRVVTRSEIMENAARYVLQQDYRDSYELFDLAPCISVYLHMDGAPLGDYDPAFNKFYSLLEQTGIEHEKCGLGGHAEPYYLRKMVDDIAPGILVPLHSFRPEQLKSNRAGKIILPQPGDVITL